MISVQPSHRMRSDFDKWWSEVDGHLRGDAAKDDAWAGWVAARTFQHREISDQEKIEFLLALEDEWNKGDNGPARCVNIVSSRLSINLVSKELQPLYRHKKRGTLYHRITTGELQTSKPVTEGTMLVVYSRQEKVYIRPVTEFEDGRFEAVPAPLTGETT